MKRRQLLVAAGLVGAVAALVTGQSLLGRSVSQQPTAPRFMVDPFWPKPLPQNWLLGSSIGVWVDDQDVIWMVHRSSATLTGGELGGEQNPPTGECCVGAPPILAFDAMGNVIHAWGGQPGQQYQGYDWPASNHGIFVDHQGNVWMGGNGGGDSHILKLTKDGRVLAQFGEPNARQSGPPGADGAIPFARNSNDPENFGRVAKIFVDAVANEVYVADGYFNKRVAVLDPTNGRMLRHWGAYGNVPDDAYVFGPRGANEPPAQQFRGPVHCADVSVDRMVYVCDRQSNRVQVFTTEGRFVSETFFQPETLGEGSVWDVAFSRDAEQRYLFVADGRNMKIRVVERETMRQLYTFGKGGRYPGMFFGAHSLATDSEGNIYTTETYEGKRIQKFVNLGEGPSPSGDLGALWPNQSQR